MRFEYVDSRFLNYQVVGGWRLRFWQGCGWCFCPPVCLRLLLLPFLSVTLASILLIGVLLLCLPPLGLFKMAEEACSAFHSLSAVDSKGETLDFIHLKDRVVLIVNVGEHLCTQGNSCVPLHMVTCRCVPMQQASAASRGR